MSAKIIQGPWSPLTTPVKTKSESISKTRRDAKILLVNYLENHVHFRDYSIVSKSRFGTVNKIAVHQKVDLETLESDADNAIYTFQRDGFGLVVFYV